MQCVTRIPAHGEPKPDRAQGTGSDGDDCSHDHEGRQAAALWFVSAKVGFNFIIFDHVLHPLSGKDTSFDIPRAGDDLRENFARSRTARLRLVAAFAA